MKRLLIIATSVYIKTHKHTHRLTNSHSSQMKFGPRVFSSFAKYASRFGLLSSKRLSKMLLSKWSCRQQHISFRNLHLWVLNVEHSRAMLLSITLKGDNRSDRLHVHSEPVSTCANKYCDPVTVQLNKKQIIWKYTFIYTYLTSINTHLLSPVLTYHTNDSLYSIQKTMNCCNVQTSIIYTYYLFTS